MDNTSTACRKRRLSDSQDPFAEPLWGFLFFKGVPTNLLAVFKEARKVGKKQRQLTFRVSEEEYIALQTIAYETRKPMAEIIREIIAKIAAGEVRIETLPPPGIRK